MLVEDARHHTTALIGGAGHANNQLYLSFGASAPVMRRHCYGVADSWTSGTRTLPPSAKPRFARHQACASHANQRHPCAFVNTGANDERVSIEGVDDQSGNAGPVTLTLPAGESRTLSASDLENGARGFAGTLGAGAGKWRLLITAGRSVVGMSLLESAGGQLTNISTAGVASDGR